VGHQTLKQGGKALPKQTKEKAAKNFVNNTELLADLKLYKAACREAAAKGEENPRIPERIGLKLYKIAEYLSLKHNFIGYSYREELISDGVLVCVKYIDKFDSDKYDNPFSYFLQCCFYAFIRRIQLEKKEQYTKMTIVENMGNLFDELVKESQDEDEEFHNHLIDTMKAQQNSDLRRLFEKKPSDKKKKDKGNTVFLEEEV
jgi:hypothetical protein